VCGKLISHPVNTTVQRKKKILCASFFVVLLNLVLMWNLLIIKISLIKILDYNPFLLAIMTIGMNYVELRPNLQFAITMSV
jgi:hypothetical protein